MHSSPAAFQVAFEEDKTLKPAFQEEHRHLPRPPFPPAKHESSAGEGHAPRCTSGLASTKRALDSWLQSVAVWWSLHEVPPIVRQGPTNPLAGDRRRGEQPLALHQAEFREKKACPQISNQMWSPKGQKPPQSS